MKTIRCLSTISLAVAVVVLGGCASAPTTKASSHSKDCINTNQINSITALDDQHLFVRVSASQHQLFTVDQPCPGLRLARTVMIADAARRVCSDGTTLIAFDYPAVGAVRCRIRQIEHVPDRATALELIEERASREE
jgi:hypothetical protein